VPQREVRPSSSTAMRKVKKRKKNKEDKEVKTYERGPRLMFGANRQVFSP